MGYLSPSLNEKLASYHAADLRARAEVRRLTHEARGANAASAARMAAHVRLDTRHHSGRRFGQDPLWRWRERLFGGLVGAVKNLLVRKGAPAQRGTVIPIREGRQTGRPTMSPVGSRCDANA